MRRFIISRLATRQPVITERFIEGYANQGDVVYFNLNGVQYSTPRASDGYFKFSITENLGNDFVVTSLDRCFSGEENYSGYGVISYVNFSRIGSLKSCETMHRLCYNQVNLNAITFDASQTTPVLKSFRDAFNECNTITELDLSMLNFDSINGDGESYDNLKSAFNNCSSLEKLLLPHLNTNLYTGSYCFRNLSSLTNLNINGIDNKDLRIPDAPLSEESAVSILTKMGNSSTVETRQCSFAASVKSIMNNYPDLVKKANAKGWNI